MKRCWPRCAALCTCVQKHLRAKVNRQRQVESKRGGRGRRRVAFFPPVGLLSRNVFLFSAGSFSFIFSLSRAMHAGPPQPPSKIRFSPFPAGIRAAPRLQPNSVKLPFRRLTSGWFKSVPAGPPSPRDECQNIGQKARSGFPSRRLYTVAGTSFQIDRPLHWDFSTRSDGERVSLSAPARALRRRTERFRAVIMRFTEHGLTFYGGICNFVAVYNFHVIIMLYESNSGPKCA